MPSSRAMSRNARTAPSANWDAVSALETDFVVVMIAIDALLLLCSMDGGGIMVVVHVGCGSGMQLLASIGIGGSLILVVSIVSSRMNDGGSGCFCCSTSSSSATVCGKRQPSGSIR